MGCAGSKQEDKSGLKGGPGGTDKKADGKATKDFQQTMTFLSKVALFNRLPKDEHPLLAQVCEPVEFKKGQLIIQQGDIGTEFFVIKSGQAAVEVAQQGGEVKKIATLKTGDYFGESALLRAEPRAATITAESDISALKITGEQFSSRGLADKLQFANRKAVGGGGGARQLEIKAPSPKTAEERNLIGKALRENTNLETMVTLDDDRVNSMIEVAWKETVPANKAIITEGDLNADYFYVVQEGNFEILVKTPENAVTPTNGDSKTVGAVGAGGSFGELALLYLTPRNATVKASEDSVVWVFDRQNFKDILMKATSQKLNEYVKLLDKVSTLDPLLAEEKMAVAQALVEMHFTKDEVIVQQGEPARTFYILYDGEVAAFKDQQQVAKYTTSKGRQVEFFGEVALLKDEKRAATIRVLSETAKALALDRDSFNMLLGPLQDIIDRGAKGTSNLNKTFAKNPNDQAREKILKKDLVRLGLLGCGGFGAVELFKHKITGETYAMKGLSKGYIVKIGMQESVMNEKNILMMTNSPFIIRLWETYNGSQTLYFLLEAALGGELYATYNRKGFHGNEKHTRFYTAGTICAFDHMHQRRIIYRDLKPENLLLNEHGKVLVTDMGLAKFVVGKTYTTCGTPDYFAPELIASTGHTNAIDWWTLGILVFELMSGHPPFESAYPMQIYSKVMKGISKVPFPPKCQGTCGDMIKELLKKEPSERLPMRPPGVDNLKKHKWFHPLDWPAFEKFQVDAPYKPVVKSKSDYSNFSARKEDMPRQIEYVDDGSGWADDFESR